MAPNLQRASRAALRLFSFGFAISFVNTQRVGPLCLIRVPLFLLLELTNDKPAEERETERDRKREERERERESTAQSSTLLGFRRGGKHGHRGRAIVNKLGSVSLVNK